MSSKKQNVVKSEKVVTKTPKLAKKAPVRSKKIQKKTAVPGFVSRRVWPD